MSSSVALKHEQSSSHKQRVYDLDTWNPQPDVDAWVHGADYDDLFDERITERMRHVDNLKDLIPFWQQQVEAASKGVELRFEEFLEMHDRKITGDEWDVQIPSWAMDTVGEERSSVTGQAEMSENMIRREDVGSPMYVDSEGGSLASVWDEDISDRDAYIFVEEVARMCSISGNKKRHMYAFYKSPTTEKISRIQDLIIALREDTYA